MNVLKLLFISLLGLLMGCQSMDSSPQTPIQISGVYPHLAYYNDEGECGTGAVVPWADRLWVITYGPHKPNGSSDKLYEITPDLEQIVRPESIGGTPANRMIHKESQQLFIGPYAIDDQRQVRTIPYTEMSGRHTGMARHLTNPEDEIYYGTMEEGFYEVDVNSLEVKELYIDGNAVRKKGNAAQFSPLLPGAHGKGLYSGQGVMVYSNNGEDVPEALKHFDIKAGALAEWDGKDWKVVRRSQFVEVTGPGGIYGNENPETDPIWATGWDHRSVLLGSRDGGRWHFYRLPKASHSYDGAHGWNTEWPRIRDVGSPEKSDYLMTMHGMFWKFPGQFNSRQAIGIRPRSAYLKVIGDFARWNNQLVFGCDDSAQREFLNKRKAKGSIEGPGQSNSNLWFTSLDQPDNLGPTTAEGAVWINDTLEQDQYSEPFLFAGWPNRVVWIDNQGEEEVSYTLEIDVLGDGQWKSLQQIVVAANSSSYLNFDKDQIGEWIRVRVDRPTISTVHFSYSDEEERKTQPHSIFQGLSSVDSDLSHGGLLYGLGDNRRTLGLVAMDWTPTGQVDKGYYELDEKLQLVKKDDPEIKAFISEQFKIPSDVIQIDSSSVLIIDDSGRRWRLPLGSDDFTDRNQNNSLRICREVATERDLFSAHGTFYELPAENADGYAKIRPVASHDFRINDYASYRGLLVMTGLDDQMDKNQQSNPHVITSADGEAKVWVGVIDDLWKLGKPRGRGGPWKNTKVVAKVPSDPYLIGFYDDRSLTITNHSNQNVVFDVEVEPIGHGPWMLYKQIPLAAGESYTYVFPDSFQSRWIRFKADKDCIATTWLEYK